MRRGFFVLWGVLVLFVLGWSGRAEAQQRCPYSANGVIDAADGAQTGRLQNGQASTCAAPKTVPAIQQAKQTFRYDAYTLKNRTGAAACVSITVTPTAGTVHSAAYLGTFDPANPQTNYLGDSGGNSVAAPLTYSVNVPSLSNVVVVVHEIGTTGATYTIGVTDCGSIIVTSITPNAGPEAGGTDVTIKGSGFLSTPTNPAVTIGAAATNVQVVDEGTITAKTPLNQTGTVDVVVTNADATTSTLPQGYTYVPASATTIALASAANPSVFGQTVTLTATATSAGGTPTGSIVFSEGATTLGTVALDGTGKAAFTKSDFTVGQHKIKATYAGNGTFAAGVSPELTQTVNVANTTTTLSSSLNPAKAGDSITFTATVVAAAPASGVPGGSVTFTDNGLLIGTSTLDAQGKATFTTSGLTGGVSHAIVATYAGAADYQTSASAPLAQEVDALTADAGTDSGTSSSGGVDSGTSSSSSSSSSSSGGVDAGSSATPADGATGGGGCDCRTAGDGSSGLAAFALGALVLGIVTRRRKRR